MSKRKSRRKPKQTQRQKNIAAWQKEAQRIRKWARNLNKQGFIVNFSEIDLATPDRITKKKLAELQSARGRALYSRAEIYAAPWKTDAQAYALMATNTRVGQKLSYTQISAIRKQQRYAATMPNESDSDVDAADTAYFNCISILNRSGTPEAQKAITFLEQHYGEPAFMQRLLQGESYIIEQCNAIAFDSKQYNRYAACVAIVEYLTGSALDMETNATLTPQ